MKTFEKHIILKSEYGKIGKEFRGDTYPYNITNDMIESLEKVEVTNGYINILKFICCSVEEYSDRQHAYLYSNTIAVRNDMFEDFGKALAFDLGLHCYNGIKRFCEIDYYCDYISKNFLHVLTHGGVYVADTLSCEERSILNLTTSVNRFWIDDKEFVRNPLSIFCIPQTAYHRDMVPPRFYL